MTELDDAAGELYGLAPEEFVAARDEKVQQAREAGQGDLVGALRALRRPTRSAWAVNMLAREDPAAVGEFLEIGERLRAAQSGLRGGDLRDLGEQRQQALAALMRRVGEVTADRPLTDALAREVNQTLSAGLADADLAELIRAGRVSQAATYAGFGAPPEANATPVRPGPRRKPAPGADQLDRLAAELTEAGETLTQVQAELDESRAAMDDARAANAAARARRTELEGELEQVDRQIRSSQHDLRAAERRAATIERRREAAQRRVEKLRSSLDEQ